MPPAMQQSEQQRLSQTVLTNDFAEFTAIREDVLLRMMEIVAEAGSSLAVPSRRVWISDPVAEENKGKAAD